MDKNELADIRVSLIFSNWIIYFDNLVRLIINSAQHLCIEQNI